ncbi:hypothetical protein GGS23DRAFT_589910 [Durotheca rogersii]|uniref:uncharacterized protein n=1 Tax=Durotheca rogersii TaxID=419775 RepID=UPI00221EF9A6|nr:uncharacterized protein GGS23DRAFT_589910 [Durotheca rogersii]KAI5855121.1 hypothetical protein GGS23DRAFT_589910 [Durotheca rogersii]
MPSGIIRTRVSCVLVSTFKFRGRTEASRRRHGNMARTASVRREIHRYSQGQIWEAQSRRRSRSVPLSRESWAPEREYGEILQRSVSLMSRARRRPHSIVSECTSPDGRDKRREQPAYEESESDEEDRRNGVPITISQNRGCELTPCLRAYISRERDRKLADKRQIQKQLSSQKSKYDWARQCYFETRGQNWDADTWAAFIALEDAYFETVDKLNSLEFEIDQFSTALLSFKDHGRISGWSREDGVLVRRLSPDLTATE